MGSDKTGLSGAAATGMPETGTGIAQDRAHADAGGTRAFPGPGPAPQASNRPQAYQAPAPPVMTSTTKVKTRIIGRARALAWGFLGGLLGTAVLAAALYFGGVLVLTGDERNGSELRPLAIGCSMGATHAVIAALRRPDLFQGCIALSGVYDADCFFGGWMDGTLYENSPTAFLPNMPATHPYVEIYNRRQIVLCVGQGAWEEDGIRSQRVLDEAFRAKGISAWCDYWGHDVNHDWPWWKKQIRYFLPIVLEDIERMRAAEQDW